MALLSEEEIEGATRRNLYWRGQVLPRWRQLAGWSLWLPCISGLFVAVVCAYSFTTDVPISEVAGFGMTYSTLSLAACVTGVVLAIGLPSGERMKRWTANRSASTGFSTYSDLVFALTWAGMAQVLILQVSIAALIVGGDVPLLPAHPLGSHVCLLAGSVGVFFYAVYQLLVLIYTFSQIGNVIDSYEWAHRVRTEPGVSSDHETRPANPTP